MLIIMIRGPWCQAVSRAPSPQGKSREVGRRFRTSTFASQYRVQVLHGTDMGAAGSSHSRQRPWNVLIRHPTDVVPECLHLIYPIRSPHPIHPSHCTTTHLFSIPSLPNFAIPSTIYHRSSHPPAEHAIIRTAIPILPVVTYISIDQSADPPLRIVHSAAPPSRHPHFHHGVLQRLLPRL